MEESVWPYILYLAKWQQEELNLLIQQNNWNSVLLPLPNEMKCLLEKLFQGDTAIKPFSAEIVHENNSVNKAPCRSIDGKICEEDFVILPVNNTQDVLDGTGCQSHDVSSLPHGNFDECSSPGNTDNIEACISGHTDKIEGVFSESTDNIKADTAGHTDNIEGGTSGHTDNIKADTSGHTDNMKAKSTILTDNIEACISGHTDNIEGDTCISESTDKIKADTSESTDNIKTKRTLLTDNIERDISEHKNQHRTLKMKLRNLKKNVMQKSPSEDEICVAVKLNKSETKDLHDNEIPHHVNNITSDSEVNENDTSAGENVKVNQGRSDQQGQVKHTSNNKNMNINDHTSVETKPFMGNVRNSVRNVEKSTKVLNKYGKNNVDRIYCKLCNKTMANKSNFIRHMERLHPKSDLLKDESTKKRKADEPKLELYACDICRKQFVDKYGLNAHKVNMHDESRSKFQCELCGAVLKHKGSLVQHMKSVHSDQRAFQCDKCDRNFKLFQQLKTHKLRHDPDYVETCVICGKTLKKGHISSHMRRHEGKRQFKCTRCPKEFYNRQDIERHMIIHRGDKPHKCPQCQYACAFKGNLTKHLQHKHRKTTGQDRKWAVGLNTYTLNVHGNGRMSETEINSANYSEKELQCRNQNQLQIKNLFSENVVVTPKPNNEELTVKKDITNGRPYVCTLPSNEQSIVLGNVPGDEMDKDLSNAELEVSPMYLHKPDSYVKILSSANDLIVPTGN